MDKFNASDTFYHELSTILPSTPRSYKIKKVRTEMNVHLRRKIHRVPEPHNGVYCSVNETLSDTIEKNFWLNAAIASITFKLIELDVIVT
eukprot:Em0792g2a